MGLRLQHQVLGSDLAKPLRWLALYLALYANDDTGASIFLSVGRMSREFGLSERHVNRLLAALQERGVIVCEARGGGRRITSYYRFDLDALTTINPDAHDRVSEATQARNPDAHDRVSRVTSGDVSKETLSSRTETLTPMSRNPDAHVTQEVLEVDVEPDPDLDRFASRAPSLATARSAVTNDDGREQSRPETPGHEDPPPVPVALTVHKLKAYCRRWLQDVTITPTKAGYEITIGAINTTVKERSLQQVRARLVNIVEIRRMEKAS
ncbi:MAG: hypothetical protein ACRD2X_03015 [Vicinamibacteraceae bacterium]